MGASGICGVRKNHFGHPVLIRLIASVNCANWGLLEYIFNLPWKISHLRFPPFVFRKAGVRLYTHRRLNDSSHCLSEDGRRQMVDCWKEH